MVQVQDIRYINLSFSNFWSNSHILLISKKIHTQIIFPEHHDSFLFLYLPLFSPMSLISAFLFQFLSALRSIRYLIKHHCSFHGHGSMFKIQKKILSFDLYWSANSSRKAAILTICSICNTIGRVNQYKFSGGKLKNTIMSTIFSNFPLNRNFTN